MAVLSLDRDTRVRAGGRVVIGGTPVRILRLSAAGAAVVARLCGGPAGAGSAAAERPLVRRLVDAGMMHPCPRPVAEPAVTVVIPVRDRALELERCLGALVDGGWRPPVIVVDDGSKDPVAVDGVCARFGAQLMRRDCAGGPATARNVASRRIATPLVAFLDSDCRPPSDWLQSLCGHFEDPVVGAVAPRVRGRADAGAGVVARFAAARSPLDCGARPARVVPGTRVSYVPTAALVVRMAALSEGFDEALRYGEDVDLVWRLHDAGWRVRYDPAVVVEHGEPEHWCRLMRRRFCHGTSAAPLAERHPERLAPFVAPPLSVATVGMALAGCPVGAAGAFGASAVRLARRLGPAGVPANDAVRMSAAGIGHTLIRAGRAATMLLPLMLGVGVVKRRSRVGALILAMTPPAVEWAQRRPQLDPVRWTLLSVADDMAYGGGVWWGSMRARSPAALKPRIGRLR